MISNPSAVHHDHAIAHQGHPAVWTGLYTGTLLIIVMSGALFAANRIPGLEHYALERNAASYSLFVIFMLIPICRFLNRPLQMYASAIIGWTMFAAGYDIAGMYFQNLFDVIHHTPFEALIEGAIVYGIFAVGSWVGGMILHASRHPMAPRHRREQDVTSHHS